MKNLDQVPSDFPILENITYLDSASTSLTPKQVIEVMNDYYYNYNANTGRGAYKIAIKAGIKIDETRQKIAKFINAKENEVVFTKNTTEAINMVANGLTFKKGDSVCISNVEHHSNFIPWLNLKDKGVKVKVVKAEADGKVEPSAIGEEVDESTKLIAIAHISNSTGSTQDIKRIGEIAHENNSLFLVDGAQSLGHTTVDSKSINADFIACPGHKGLLGPVGTGFLYLKEEIAEHLKPVSLGGGTVTDVEAQNFTLESVPYRFEGGTQNVSGIVGLGEAIDYINNIGISSIEKHCFNLTHELWSRLSELDSVRLYGNHSNIHNIVSFNIDNMNPYDVAKILDETGNICVRSGFHCAIPAIKHFNATDGTVRASVHCYNTIEDVDKIAIAIDEIAKAFSD